MTTQRTLTGDEADAEYQPPQTLLYCETCDERILRSRRHDHPHDCVELPDEDDDGLPEQCQIDTRQYRVDITMEVVETVTVEAADEAEAKHLAEERRDYRGEYMADLHTEVWTSDSPSQASTDYLKQFGLLDEDDE